MGAQALIDLRRPDTSAGADSLIVSHSFPPTVNFLGPVADPARGLASNIGVEAALFKGNRRRTAVFLSAIAGQVPRGAAGFAQRLCLGQAEVGQPGMVERGERAALVPDRDHPGQRQPRGARDDRVAGPGLRQDGHGMPFRDIEWHLNQDA